MKKKILLIEDEKDLVQVMKKRLLVAGYVEKPFEIENVLSEIKRILGEP